VKVSNITVLYSGERFGMVGGHSTFFKVFEKCVQGSLILPRLADENSISAI
jgi:hypothetical protein